MYLYSIIYIEILLTLGGNEMAVVNRKRICTSISFEHYDNLMKVCEDNKQKQSAVLEIALDLLKKEMDNGKNLSNIIEYINSSNK